MATMFLPLLSLAQAPAVPATQGTIVYEHTTQMRRNLVGLDPSIANRIPQVRTQRYELFFNTQNSLYRKIEDDEVNNGFGGGEGGGNFRVITRGGPQGGGATHLFRNLSNRTSVQEVEVGDDTYLLQDTLKAVGMMESVPDSVRRTRGKLKLQADSVKTIAGYRCQRASMAVEQRAMSSAQRENMRKQMEEMRSGAMSSAPRSNSFNMQGDSVYTSETVFWYTTEIPVQAGPALFGNMPGMVMRVEVNGGRSVWTAIEVKPTLRDKDLKEPSRGKRITKAEYAQKMEAYMQQLSEMGGMQMRRF